MAIANVSFPTPLHVTTMALLILMEIVRVIQIIKEHAVAFVQTSIQVRIAILDMMIVK